MESSSNAEEDKKTKEKPRFFLPWQKELCWQKATPIYGRDPDRWRSDALGNPLLNALRGCPGPYCHEYDHIVPFSKGGQTVIENCQVLQTAVNRYKSNKVDVDMNELKAASVKVQPTRRTFDFITTILEKEMDFLEYAAYGNVRRLDETFTNKLE